MLQIIKNRKDTESISSFLSSFKIDKKICIPMLYDGSFETILAKNNTLECIPADDNFKTLWEVLRDEPASLSRFIEIYKAKKESNLKLSQILNVQKNKIPRAYVILSLCARSDSSSLMGGKLTDKEHVFTNRYLSYLKKYRPPFSLQKKIDNDALIFQDLTYLTLEEIETLREFNNCLFITNNKQHIHLFDGAECSIINEYFLIWR